MRDATNLIEALINAEAGKSPVNQAEPIPVEEGKEVTVTLIDADSDCGVASATLGEKRESFTTYVGDHLRIRVSATRMALLDGRYLKGSDTVIAEKDLEIRFLDRFILTRGEAVRFYAKQRRGVVEPQNAMPGSPVYVVSEGSIRFPEYITEYDREPVLVDGELQVFRFSMPARSVSALDFQ